MLGYTPLMSRRPPPEQAPPPPPDGGSACWEIRATSGRCVSYWNAILLFYYFSSTQSLSFHSTTLYDIRNGVMILVLSPESPSGTISLVIFLFTPFPVFTVRNSSCGKVMFLHQSVILFTGWGGVCPWVQGCIPPWTDTPVHTPSPRQTPPKQTPPGQTTPQANTPR